VLASPKFHAQVVGCPVDLSVKEMLWALVGFAGLKVKEEDGATAAAVTVMLLVTLLDPAVLLAVSVTEKLPALLYV